jgi:hypothetical protein
VIAAMRSIVTLPRGVSA